MSAEPAYADPIAPAHACRNCGAPVPGEYCATCGQETRLKLPTARVFMREATGRYFSLDGRMWRTLAALLFRPGFLTREYFAGRRRRYIRPARLFLVLSLALFAAIRLFASAPVIVSDDVVLNADETAKDIAKEIAKDSAKSTAKPVLKFDDGENGGDLFNVPGFTIHVDRDFNLDLTDANAALDQGPEEAPRAFQQAQSAGKVRAGLPGRGALRALRDVRADAGIRAAAAARVFRARAAAIRIVRAATRNISCSRRTRTHFCSWSACWRCRSPSRRCASRWRSGACSTESGRRKRYTAGDGAGCCCAAIVVGVAYIMLFALVIVGLLMVAVLVR